MTLPPRVDRDDLILALTAGDELEDCEHFLDAQTGLVLYAGEGVEDLPADLRSNPRYIHCFEKIIQDAGLLGRKSGRGFYRY